jgi:hypothetical protein
MWLWLLLAASCSFFAVLLRSLYREDRNKQQDQIRCLHARVFQLEKAITTMSEVLQQYSMPYEIREVGDGKLALFVADKCLAVASSGLSEAMLIESSITDTQAVELLYAALHREVKHQLSSVSVVKVIQVTSKRFTCVYLCREGGNHSDVSKIELRLAEVSTLYNSTHPRTLSSTVQRILLEAVHTHTQKESELPR